MLINDIPTSTLLSEQPDLESRLIPDSCEHLRTWLRFLSCGRLIESEIRSRLRRDFNTTLPRFELLALLEKHPTGIKMSDISRHLMVTNGNITGITDQLVKDELIQRFKLPQDRRTSLLKLTAKGRVQLAEINAAHNEWVCTLFGQLSASTITHMLGSLNELKSLSQTFVTEA